MIAIGNTQIDDTVKPALEWIEGRCIQQLLPTDIHGILQFAFAKFIEAWAKVHESKKGKVITEWRFITPAESYKTASLVPDVGYLSNYFDLPKHERTYPRVPPDIVVEILSPDDDLDEVALRRSFLLWWGVKLVLIVDPPTRSVEAHEQSDIVTIFSEGDLLTSRTFPSLALPLRTIFAELDEPG